jgi:alanine racemase
MFRKLSHHHHHHRRLLCRSKHFSFNQFSSSVNTVNVSSLDKINDAARLKHASWASIDLTAIEENARYFSSFGRLMSVIKADGYGHGALACGEAALRGGSTEFAVARADEALELRANGFNAPLLLFGYCPPAIVADLIENDVALTIWSQAQLDQIQSVVQRHKNQTIPAKIHININSGMNRTGIDVNNNENLQQFNQLTNNLAQLHKSGKVQWKGVYTHFACAGEFQ